MGGENARALLLGPVLRWLLVCCCGLGVLVPLDASATTTCFYRGNDYVNLSSTFTKAWCDGFQPSGKECLNINPTGQNQTECGSADNQLPRYSYLSCNESNGSSCSSKSSLALTRGCDGTDEYDPYTGTCVPVAPPRDCTTTPNIRHMMKADDVIAAGTWPETVSDGGCEYSPAPDGPPNCRAIYQVSSGQYELFCDIPYAPTGSPDTGPATWAEPDTTSPSTDNTSQPPVHTTEEPVPVNQPDTPDPGDNTEIKTKTDQTEWKPATDIQTDTNTTTITTSDGVTITQTTTTTTTTKADGSSSTTTTVTFDQTPEPITQTKFDSSGTPSTTTSENPGKSGTTTSTSSTGADGSKTTGSTETGVGGDGTGTDPNPNDPEPTDTPFTGPESGGQDGFSDTAGRVMDSINNAPIVQALSGLSVANPTGSCPAFSVDTGAIAGTISTTLHCEIWDAVKSVLPTIMIAVWSFVGIRILGSA